MLLLSNNYEEGYVVSIESEITDTAAGAWEIMRDEDSPLLLAGSLVGISAGVAFMIGVEGVDSHDHSFMIPELQAQVTGLHEAEASLSGTPQAVRASATKINKAIAQKHVEIKQDAYHTAPPGEVLGPLVGGTAMGVFVFAAVGARVRLFKQRRAAQHGDSTATV